MIIFHHNDLDGRCAAAIVNYHHTVIKRGNTDRIKFVEMDYHKPCPLEMIQKQDMVVIVDFSFKPDVFQQIRDRLEHPIKQIIWCDHHKTCQAYPYSKDPILGQRDFTEKGLSGCELTWQYFIGKDMPLAVSLVGDYDSWRLQQGARTFKFYEAMKLHDTNPAKPFWFAMFDKYNGNLVENICQEGGLVIRYRDAYCDDIRKAYSYETMLEGHKALVMNVCRFGSSAFGDAFDQYPICISYIHDGKKFIVSLYSKTVDVGAIAQKFGGGGHAGAAGFTCMELPF